MKKWLQKNTIVVYYNLAARNGNVNAHAKLGDLYEKNEEIEQALRSYLTGAIHANQVCENSLKRFSSQGIDTADYCLGILYEYREDWELAKEYYEKAAAHNHSQAMYRLGCLYKVDRISASSKNVVFNKNLSEELLWYRRAASYYNKYALNTLLEMSANMPEASVQLAQLYENGDNGFGKNIKRAAKFYRKAGQLGDVNAAFYVAMLYEMGQIGLQQDYQEAFKNYEVAAKKQHPSSLEKLVDIAKKLQDPLLEHKVGEIFQFFYFKNLVASEWYKKSADKGYKPASTQLRNLAQTDLDLAFTLALAYEKTNPELACTYYLMAAQKGHKESFLALERLFQQLSDGKMFYELANIYYKVGNIEAALQWYKRSADKSYKSAFAQMRSLALADSNLAFMIGKTYEKLGQGKTDVQLACTYYLMAAQKSHKEAFLALERLFQELPNGKMFYELANIYDRVGNTEQAVKWYLRAVEQRYEPALSYVEKMVIDVGKFAYLAAQFYKLGQEVKRDTAKAYVYYGNAAYQNHMEAKALLELDAQSGIANAQYALGYHYYHKKNDFFKAIHWCMQAIEQGHTLALSYLTTTDFSADICSYIAGKYEQGDGVHQDVKLAVQFYEKAYAKGDQRNAAYQLGNIYQANYSAVPKNEEKAFQYYLVAAKKGNKDAFFSLDRLGEEVNANKQKELADLYRLFSCGRKMSHWHTQTQEAQPATNRFA